MKKVLFAIAMLAAMPAHADDLKTLTASYLDVNGENLADTPETVAIAMDQRGFLNQLTLHIAVTWGTSTEVVAKCKTAISESGTYTWVDKCVSDGTYEQCKPLLWRWNSTDSPDGLGTLEMRSNDKFAICQFDDAADGTGTIVATGSRGKQ